MKFSDIPQFTRSSPYRVDVAWSYLEKWLVDNEKDCSKFDLDPDFQRHHVWDDEKRIAYVEFILRGGKSSRDLYFNCANYTGSGIEGAMELVDGKQRLEAVRKYLRSEIPAFGVLYKDMEGTLRITGPSFKIHVNDLQTRAEVLQWYLDLNTGGVVHSKDEINRVKALLEKENEQR